MSEHFLADSVSPESVAKSGKTEFKVLLTDEAYGEITGFLDRYLGKEYEIVKDPENASIHVIVSQPDGRFRASDVACANQIFDRDGAEARVYEYDPYDKQLKARTRDYINRRSQ